MIQLFCFLFSINYTKYYILILNIEILRKIYKNYKKNSTKKIIINATYILLRSMNSMNIYIHSFIIYIYIYYSKLCIFK